MSSPVGRSGPERPGSERPRPGRALWKRWSLRRQVAILVIALGASALVVNALSALITLQTRHAIEQQERMVGPASQDVNALSTALETQEASERSYVITADPADLRPYETGQQQVDRLLPQLRRELQGQPEELGELEALTTSDRGWLARVAKPEISDVASGNVAGTRATEDRDAGSTAFSQVRRKMTVLADDVAGRARATDTAVLHDTVDDLVVTVGRTIALLAIFALLWLLLGRLVFRPIDRLNRDVKAVTEGQLDRPVATYGPVEIATLGRDTEAMRRRLRRDVDELRQLRQALDERSPLQGLIRSELEAPSGGELGISVASRLLPAEGVLAGDWHDAWAVDDERVALALVDVSGHGPEAGLMALRIKHLIAPPFRMGLDPGASLGWMVDQLVELDEQCATAIVVDIDHTSGRCRYANAGHPAAMLVHGREVTLLGPTGPLISALGGTWATREVRPAPGDLLVLITDGLTEARMPDGNKLGTERLVNLLKTLDPSTSPDDVAEQVVSAVRAVALGPLRDDATVVVVGFDPPLDRRHPSHRRGSHRDGQPGDEQHPRANGNRSHRPSGTRRPEIPG